MAGIDGTRLCLHSYENGGQDFWCWEDTDTLAVSQEFTSREAALEAWRKGELIFERSPSD